MLLPIHLHLLGGGQGLGRDVDAHVAERLGLAGQAEALLRLFRRQLGFFREGGFGQLAADQPHQASGANADAAADGNQVDPGLLGGVHQTFTRLDLDAPAYRLEVDRIALPGLAFLFKGHTTPVS